MDAEKVAELKNFVEQCKSNPSIIHNPSLVFFKTYLQSLGARIPPAVPKSVSSNILDIVESDVELDNIDVVEPDNDPPQKMGDRSIEVTEENRDASQILKSKAMDSISEDKLHEAIDHLTEAVMLNPSSSILYATRASVYVKLNKPIAAIRDADAALQINPDSAKGYKIRGMARAMLGQWEAAAKDLHVASNLDYDEEIGMVLKKVEPNAHRIEEHRRKYERLHKEREQRKIEHARKQRRGEVQDPEAASALKEATWCGPCRFISPLFTTLAGKYQKVVFLKVDIDEATDAAARWNISSVPSFFFIKNEEEIDKVVGADKSSLERKIAQYAS
ncbi:hypothetical protein CsSME_00054158 [Camellia sinensis var. sinensis]